MINGASLSITTGCLNRTDFLKQSLATWLRANEPDEIIIVDWSNEVPLEESLKEFRDSRIVIVRATDQPNWKNAKCHNLEVELASGCSILRLDSDYRLHDDFFTKHNLTTGMFFAGNWRPHVENVDKCSLAGTLYAYREDVLAVNGYNERLLYYGCEDDDLFERMVARRLRRVDIDTTAIDHIPHSDLLRYEKMAIFSDLPRMSDHREHDESLKKLYLVDKSRIIANKRPWSSSDLRTRWNVTWRGDHKSAICFEITAGRQRSDLSREVHFSSADISYLFVLGGSKKSHPTREGVSVVGVEDERFNSEVIKAFFEEARKWAISTNNPCKEEV